MENDGPGVVYDALGVNGIGANALLRSDKDHWRAQLAHRAPNLVILNFGTNEATEPKLDIAFFKIGLKQVIDEIRKALPSSSILIMAPLDRAEKRGADLATMPNIPKIVAAEREWRKKQASRFGTRSKRWAATGRWRSGITKSRASPPAISCTRRARARTCSARCGIRRSPRDFPTT
ncbi:MAG: hypothetical protein M5R36_09425 [Deltaproteobacteria bacterium]|nr:hypothetical protein [Deltaproteobacteria bacterium]